MRTYFHLFILELGELYRKGERGFLVESRSVKSIFFSIGLHVLGLDFRLLICERVKQIIALNQNMQEVTCFYTWTSYMSKQAQRIQHIPSSPLQIHYQYACHQNHGGSFLCGIALIVFCSPHPICCFLQTKLWPI